MKILLLNPPLFDFGKFERPLGSSYSPPLGIASIAAVLEKAGYEVKAVDLYY